MGVPQPPDAITLVARSQMFYDDQGRTYRTSIFSVDPNNGTNVSTASLNTNTYYDHRGNVMAVSQPGGLWTKSLYDGANRATIQYTSDGGKLNAGTNYGAWSTASNVASDIVLQQAETTYDANSNPILITTRQRFHDAATNGTTALGDLRDPSNNPKARVSFEANYYDAANRLTTSADIGTNGTNGAFTRPASWTSIANTALFTFYGYDDAGRQDTVAGPRLINGNYVTNKTYFDLLSRPTRTIANWDSSDQSPASHSIPTVFGSTVQITDNTYNGNDNVLTMKAWGTNSTTFQTTQYNFLTRASNGSGLDSNDLLSSVQYPDKSTGNPGSGTAYAVVFAYNALGNKLSMTDRNGTTHGYSFDALGRATSDVVTTLGSGVDGSVRSFFYAFDSAGRPYTQTAYSGTTTASTIKSQVLDQYNGLGQLTKQWQAIGAAVSTTNAASVQYVYDEMAGGANDSRLLEMIYSNGRKLHYGYDNSLLDNAIGRVDYLADDNGSNP